MHLHMHVGGKKPQGLNLLTNTHSPGVPHQGIAGNGCECGHGRGRGVATIVREPVAKGKPILLNEHGESLDGAVIRI